MNESHFDLISAAKNSRIPICTTVIQPSNCSHYHRNQKGVSTLAFCKNAYIPVNALMDPALSLSDHVQDWPVSLQAAEDSVPYDFKRRSWLGMSQYTLPNQRMISFLFEDYIVPDIKDDRVTRVDSYKYQPLSIFNSRHTYWKVDILTPTELDVTFTWWTSREQDDPDYNKYFPDMVARIQIGCCPTGMNEELLKPNLPLYPGIERKLEQWKLTPSITS